MELSLASEKGPYGANIAIADFLFVFAMRFLDTIFPELRRTSTQTGTTEFVLAFQPSIKRRRPPEMFPVKRAWQLRTQVKSKIPVVFVVLSLLFGCFFGFFF